MISGEAVQGRIQKIDADGKIVFVDGTESHLMGVLRIDRAIQARPNTKPGLIIYLRGGGMILADSFALRDQSCLFTWAIGKNISVAIEDVRAILLAPVPPWSDASLSKLDEGFVNAVRSSEVSKTDVVFVQSENKLQRVDCLVRQVSDDQVGVVWNDRPRVIARSRVYGVVMAQLEKAPEATSGCMVTVADGSSLWSGVVVYESDELELQIGKRSQAALPWDAVARLEVRSDRVMFLSDVEPVAVEQKSIAAWPWPWRRDATVLGHPIVLAGKTYKKGIGVHAYTSLAYDVPSGFAAFVAVIGLQGPVENKGDCVFVLVGDGKELFRARMKGGDASQPMRVDIQGVRRLTLIVEPGEDLDLADHAVWADARLLREKNAP